MGSFISTTQGDHCPTPDDVFAVRRFLLAFVPVELANLILNEANYWPKATWSFEPENPLIVFASDNRWSDAASCCLLTPKLCDLLYGGKVEPYKIKTICFKTMSHDQGWCSNGDFSGRYEGSYTWFEAVIVRDSIVHVLRSEPGPDNDYIESSMIQEALHRRYFNPEVDSGVITVKTPDDDNSDTWNIQRNERANGKFQLHTVVWTDEEEAEDESILMNETGRGLGRGFVRSLKKEDRIAVLARAKYPGWVNYIKSVELEIYYSV